MAVAHVHRPQLQDSFRIDVCLEGRERVRVQVQVQVQVLVFYLVKRRFAIRAWTWTGPNWTGLDWTRLD